MPHLALRLFADHGFALDSNHWLAIRGVSFQSPSASDLVHRLFETLRLTLPGASLLPALGARWIWATLCYVGVVFAMMDRTRRHTSLLGALVILSFVVMYAASPFFESYTDKSSEVAYRHLTYIIPLLVSMAVYGSVCGKGARRAVAVALIGLGCWGGLDTWVRASPPSSPAYDGAGWILGQKFGHDPHRLARLLEIAPPETRRQLAVGYGWGLAAALLAETFGGEEERIQRLIELVDRFPGHVHPWVVEGTERAFEPFVTPELDPSLLPLLRQALRENYSASPTQQHWSDPRAADDQRPRNLNRRRVPSRVESER